MLANGHIIGDGSWNLRVYVTDLKTERVLRVKGDLHIGGVMLKLVEELGKFSTISYYGNVYYVIPCAHRTSDVCLCSIYLSQTLLRFHSLGLGWLNSEQLNNVFSGWLPWPIIDTWILLLSSKSSCFCHPTNSVHINKPNLGLTIWSGQIDTNCKMFGCTHQCVCMSV